MGLVKGDSPAVGAFLVPGSHARTCAALPQIRPCSSALCGVLQKTEIQSNSSPGNGKHPPDFPCAFSLQRCLVQCLANSCQKIGCFYGKYRTFSRALRSFREQCELHAIYDVVSRKYRSFSKAFRCPSGNSLSVHQTFSINSVDLVVSSWEPSGLHAFACFLL